MQKTILTLGLITSPMIMGMVPAIPITDPAITHDRATSNVMTLTDISARYIARHNIARPTTTVDQPKSVAARVLKPFGKPKKRRLTLFPQELETRIALMRSPLEMLKTGVEEHNKGLMIQAIQDGANPEKIPGWKRLLNAAMAGNEVEISGILANGVAVNAVNKDLLTPLYCAAGRGHVQVIQTLLAAGAWIDARTKLGNTPLHIAAESNEIAAMNALLQAGADIGTQNIYGCTPLHMTVANGKLEATRMLLDARANTEAKTKEKITPLHFAAEQNNVAILELLLAAGANINAISDEGDTYLHWAANRGANKTTKRLLDLGLDINVRNILDETPLHLAAVNGHKTTVEQLLAAGADLTLKTNAGDPETKYRNRMAFGYAQNKLMAICDESPPNTDLIVRLGQIMLLLRPAELK